MSSTNSAERPKIEFPKGSGRNVFEGTKTGDPKKDAVLADLTQGIDSVDEAIFKGSLKSRALAFYNVDKALVTSSDYVKGYVDKGQSWVGTTRYSDWRITPRDDGAVSVVYCSDESKSNISDRKTGKVDKTPTSADSYVLYNARLKKNSSGVWQTVDVVSERGADQCQP
ncbi:hypothetical protein [Streptomyces sp. NPDC051776]|uniref:hypothetical protein n=1 Tax=Streptomyces sp. NPDC051776 TaxID=3155414 RepID=UPI00342D0C48